MSERRGRFRVLLISMILAQAAINVLVWFVWGWPGLWLAYFAIASGLLIAIFAGLAAASASRAARPSETGTEGFAYLRILTISFLFTVTEAIIIILWPLGRREGSHEFQWTGLIVSLAIAAALFISAAFITAAMYFSDAYTTSYALDILSRRVFRQPLAPGFGVVGGQFGVADIQDAVPLEYPGGEPRGPAGLAGDLARGTAWADGLLAANSGSRPRRGVPTPAVTAVGFVRLRSERANLAIINYFQPGRLFGALLTMPRKIKFAERTFPIVARPWLPVPHSGDVAEDGHCWVTFGEDAERYGVVTAKHVLAQPKSKPRSHVSTRTSRTEIAGALHAASDKMDAALIDLSNGPRPRLIPAPHTRDVAEFWPIRLCTSRGHVDGYIIGLTECSRGGFYAGNPASEPVEAARVFLSVSGEKGDSGSLVLDIKGERNGAAPYLMYMGIEPLTPSQEGIGILLAQISYHWQINTQFNLQSGFNPINAILENDE